MEHHINYVLEGCRKGDKECAMELIEEATPNIHKIINSYNINGDLKEELLQEGYIIVLKTARTYDPKSGTPYFGYLKRALYYGLYDKLHKRDEVYLEDRIFEGKRIIDFIEDPKLPFDEALSEREEHEMLLKALLSLEDDERQVIIDKFFRKRTYREIAKGYGVKYTAVLYLAGKALDNLRKLMNEKIL